MSLRGVMRVEVMAVRTVSQVASCTLAEGHDKWVGGTPSWFCVRRSSLDEFELCGPRWIILELLFDDLSELTRLKWRSEVGIES
jgi:hypothetical protein